VKFELAGVEVVIRDEGGVVIWRGEPDGHPVKALSPLEDREGAIVLLDYMSGPKNFSNLLLLRSNGTVAWHAAPPDTTGNDAFVEFRWDRGDLYAYSWSGYLVQIDPASGSLKDRKFVK
jgi:hypothetical protein